MIERIATYNLAEVRLWQGSLDDAVQLARRGLSLLRGHGEGSTWVDELLLARVLAARGDVAEVRSLVAQIAAHDIGEDNRVVVGILRCFAEDAPAEQWRPSLERASVLLTEDLQLELAALAQRRQVLSRPQLARIRKLARNHPAWSRRAVF
jgi:hypothetical protein